MIFNPLLGWIGLGVILAALLTLCLIPLIRGDGPRWKWFARIGVVAVLGLALARPGIAVSSSTEEYEAAADVYFVVDTTTSMAAEDYDGSQPRIEGVKEDMLELAKQLPGARLSIITFASTASTAMPLTTDHAAFASAVDVLSPETSHNSNGSTITEAGDELRTRLDANAEDRSDNASLVFYFGDGEQTTDGPPDSWASLASRFDSGGVFGYGTSQGGKMKQPQPFGYSGDQTGGDQTGGDQGEGPGLGSDSEYVLDGQGNPGISRIDEGNLKQIASDLGVDYHHRDGGTPMSAAYTAPTYDQQLVKKDGRVTVDEYYWIPLILVFAWIAAEMVFGVRELLRLRAVAPPRRGPNGAFPGPSPQMQVHPGWPVAGPVAGPQPGWPQHVGGPRHIGGQPQSAPQMPAASAPNGGRS